MSAFFRDAQHHLTIDGVPLDRLMTEFGSQLYVYSGTGLQRAFTAFQTAVAPVSGKLHFALKANSALGVIALLARCGAGADIVSAGELARALAAGIAAGDIVFSGVGKSAADIRDIYSDADLSDAARQAYVATLRRIARGIDLDAEAHELNAKELAALGLAENQVVIFMVTDGQRVALAESVAQGVATTVLTLGWLTAWEQSGFFTLAAAIDASGSVAWYGYRGPYSVSGPDAYKEMILSIFDL